MVEKITQETQLNSRELLSGQALRVFARGRDPNRERVVLGCFYQCLLEQYRVHYLPPGLISKPVLERPCQTIRPPHRLFPNPIAPDGQGTCLDLVLLVAACLENVGLWPVVILTGDREELPEHALLGCWIGSIPGAKPILGKEEITRRLDEGQLLLLECTGFAHVQDRPLRRLDFAEAQAAAERQIRGASWGSGVDIGALRPPNGSITPLECPIEPEVASAYAHAQQAARDHHRHVLETVHLFYGLLAAAGPLIQHLFQQTGLDLHLVQSQVLTMILPQNNPGEPEPSRTYLECQRLAQEYAWQTGHRTSVREADLFWALIDHGFRRSESLGALCRRLQVDLDQLAQLASRQYPRPAPILSGSLPSGPIH